MPSPRLQISELATVRSGYHFRGKVEPVRDGEFRVIQIKDFDAEHTFHPESLDRVNPDRDGRPHLISKGDVLFLSRGHKRFASAITRGQILTIAPSYFYIVRMTDQRILPEYLAWYMNQAPFQEELANLATGTHMPFVSLEEFRKLTVPVPIIEIQSKIAALYALSRREQRLIRDIEDRRAKIDSHRRRSIELACLRAIRTN
jgi:hypothetical protein